LLTRNLRRLLLMSYAMQQYMVDDLDWVGDELPFREDADRTEFSDGSGENPGFKSDALTEAPFFALK
jgi:hypothetical protein